MIKRLIKQNHNYFLPSDIQYSLSSSKGATKKTKVEKFSYPSGAVYKGEWLGGFRHGIGTMNWPDGAQYQGCWSYGYPYGFGKFTHTDGDCYSGEWKSPYSGSNTSYYKDKLPQDPKSKMQDGYCNLYLVWLWQKQESFTQNPEKSSKIQSFKFSMNHEKTVKNVEKKILSQVNSVKDTRVMLEEIFSENFGRIFSEVSLEAGARYKGEIIGGKRVGKGINVWENGDVYKGEWERDLQHGSGWNIWVDGSKYVGGYRDNMKDGLGEYVWEDGTKYTGGWKDNNIDGVGIYLWSDGREYIGEWSCGVMHGFGMFTAKDGKKYQGKWQNGKKHGIGYTIHRDGKITMDNWENGRIQKSNII